MTSDSPKAETSPKGKSPSRRKKMSQERMMVIFTLFFIVGILLLVLMPEGHPARGLAMGLYTVAVMWSIFRFGM